MIPKNVRGFRTRSCAKSKRRSGKKRCQTGLYENIQSLRRHDPDQVQGSRRIEAVSQSPVGTPLGMATASALRSRLSTRREKGKNEAPATVLTHPVTLEQQTFSAPF